MQSLNKTHTDQLSKLITELEEKSGAIADCYNDLKDAHESLTEAITSYNDSLENIQKLRDGIVEEITDYADQQNDEWQESLNAEAYQEWIAAWESANLDALDLPEEPEEPEAMHADEIQDLPLAIGER